jgi:NH3-dependent NAD+ synthetase
MSQLSNDVKGVESKVAGFVTKVEGDFKAVIAKVEHVVKADFDALVARVEALEAAVKKAV